MSEATFDCRLMLYEKRLRRIGGAARTLIGYGGLQFMKE